VSTYSVPFRIESLADVGQSWGYSCGWRPWRAPTGHANARSNSGVPDSNSKSSTGAHIVEIMPEATSAMQFSRVRLMPVSERSSTSTCPCGPTRCDLASSRPRRASDLQHAHTRFDRQRVNHSTQPG
jgi:hypothetical protein